MDGLDANYFKKSLERIARDADSYTPHEMETALTRLAEAAKSQTTHRCNKCKDTGLEAYYCKGEHGTEICECREAHNA